MWIVFATPCRVILRNARAGGTLGEVGRILAIALKVIDRESQRLGIIPVDIHGTIFKLGHVETAAFVLDTVTGACVRDVCGRNKSRVIGDIVAISGYEYLLDRRR